MVEPLFAIRVTVGVTRRALSNAVADDLFGDSGRSFSKPGTDTSNVSNEMLARGVILSIDQD